MMQWSFKQLNYAKIFVAELFQVNLFTAHFPSESTIIKENQYLTLVQIGRFDIGYKNMENCTRCVMNC